MTYIQWEVDVTAYGDLCLLGGLLGVCRQEAGADKPVVVYGATRVCGGVLTVTFALTLSHVQQYLTVMEKDVGPRVLNPETIWMTIKRLLLLDDDGNDDDDDDEETEEE